MATLANYRFKAIEDFDRARRWAKWAKFWATLRRQESQLLSFDTMKPFLGSKRYRGIQEIPVQSIVGSIGRVGDFDRNFRPLDSVSYNRWGQIYVLAHWQGWPPIEVHKVGNLYFVEDGHHRVSVARQLKNKTIEAIVWDYDIAVTFDPNISPDNLVSQLECRRQLLSSCCPDYDQLTPTAVC